MPREKDLNLWRYGISKERYKYLNAFCRQYKEWVCRSNINRGLKAVNVDGMPHTNAVSNPTEQAALKNLKYLEGINTVKQTCKEADAGIWEYLFYNATLGITYEYMNVPCGRKQFYNSRRKFYYMLDLKLS